MTDRIRAAAAGAIRQIKAGQAPTAADLEAAPVLDVWTWRKHWGHPALEGFVTGHPVIIDGDSCLTSPVIAIDPDRKWVRTISRFYRLGRPLADAIH